MLRFSGPESANNPTPDKRDPAFDVKSEYASGSSYSLTPTTAVNTLLDFSVYAVADLNNNNQPRSAGLYKDTVAITITW